VLLKYHAKSVNAVMASASDAKIEARVFLDDYYLRKDEAGKDVTIDENGKSRIVIDHSGMYNLVDTKEYGEHELKTVTPSKEFHLCVYTFG
jgi:hypothetical protein